MKTKNGIVESMKSWKLKLKKIKKLPSYQLMLLALGVGFGVLIAAQWHTLPTRVTNPISPYLSLKDTRNTLLAEQDQLKVAIQKDQQQLSGLQKNIRSNSKDNQKISELEIQKSKAGLTKLKGPGITINLDDSKQGPVSDDSIVHASDLRDIVNLLWGARAEAISINGERVAINTSIDCIVNTILVNNTHLTTPFKIEATGDQRLLFSQLENKNNLSDLHRRREANGLIFEISNVSNLIINPFNGSFDIKSGE